MKPGHVTKIVMVLLLVMVSSPADAMMTLVVMGLMVGYSEQRIGCGSDVAAIGTL
jgi:hypothetical protein